MSDARLRSLERASEHDPDAEARLFEEHVRRGDLAVAVALLERFPDQAGGALAARLAGPGADRLAQALYRGWIYPDQVRARPAMYLGRGGPDGLRPYLEALVEPSLERSLGPDGPRRLDVELRPDGTVVVDDDDGAHGRWQLRAIGNGPFTPVALTGAEDPDRALVPYPTGRPPFAGLLACANALSADLFLQTRPWDGAGWEQRYARGRLVENGPAIPRGTSRDRVGTRLVVRPDPEVFGPGRVDPEPVRGRFRELAPLVPRLTLTLTGPDGLRETFHAPEGLVDTVGPRTSTPVACLEAAVDRGACRTCGGTIRLQAALAWRGGGQPAEVHAWANLRRDDRGRHVDGFLAGVEAALARAGRRRRRRWREYSLRGLVASLSVLVPNPTFRGSRWNQLDNPEVAAVVARAVEEQLAPWFELHPPDVAD